MWPFKNKKQSPQTQKKGLSGYGGLYNNYIFGDFKPSWRSLSESYYLLQCYVQNPVVQATINIKANAFSNLKFVVKNLSDEEEIPLEQYTDENLKRLLLKPNPLQRRSEWLKQFKTNLEVFGNGYIYASTPLGFNNIDFDNITTLKNLPPYRMWAKHGTMWLEATEIDEIIEYYRFRNFDGKETQIQPQKVMHLNDVNITHEQYQFTQGQSRLIGLQRPISNIDAAYESRNVMIERRGAIGMLTNDKRDGEMGAVPLKEEEIEEIQENYRKYGLQEHQYNLLISNQPLKYQKMAQNVRELMLFEEVEADAIAVANAYGVPELLVKYYIKGGTFNNLNVSERRLYDSTIIPETEEFMVALNDFLGTQEKGIKLLGSYAHVKVLQENQKEEAETHATNERAAASAFLMGAITYNQYLGRIGLPNDTEIGDDRIWDLTPERISIIRNRFANVTIQEGTVTTQANGTE